MSRDKLYFYSKSRDVPPGRGTNEFVADECNYADLAKIPNWRRLLSNFHAPGGHIKYGGHEFMTIEHAFQSTKIALRDPITAKSFAIESGSALALHRDGSEAQKNRKIIKLNPEEIDKWSQMSINVMKDAAMSLYSDPLNEYERSTLLATKESELWHIQNRKPAIRFMHLEEVRSILKKSSICNINSDQCLIDLRK